MPAWTSVRTGRPTGRRGHERAVAATGCLDQGPCRPRSRRGGEVRVAVRSALSFHGGHLARIFRHEGAELEVRVVLPDEERHDLASLGKPLRRTARRRQPASALRGRDRARSGGSGRSAGSYASGTIFELRITRSRVSNGTPCTTLVAAISSSAGSPLKSRAVDARATPKSMGQR